MCHPRKGSLIHTRNHGLTFSCSLHREDKHRKGCRQPDMTPILLSHENRLGVRAGSSLPEAGGLFWWPSGEISVFPVQGVSSLIGDLIPHTPCGMAEKKMRRCRPLLTPSIPKSKGKRRQGGNPRDPLSGGPSNWTQGSWRRTHLPREKHTCLDQSCWYRRRSRPTEKTPFSRPRGETVSICLPVHAVLGNTLNLSDLTSEHISA